MFNRAGIFIPLDAPFTHINLTIGTWPCLPRFHGDLFDGSLDSQLAELESVLATV
ncbi:MAG TPA: hypothetical protein VGQ82_11090 [Chthoniobacterales bacterium]|nr:hypothetical protein [Chthoniobacterales bacterium]